MLDDIRLIQLLQLENPYRYANLFTHVRGKTEIKILCWKIKARDVNDMTFDEVSVIRKKLSKQLITPDDILHVFRKFFPSRLPKRAYLMLRVSKFYPCYNHILNTIRKIAEAENVHWQPNNVDLDWKKAGSENLSKFAEYSIAAEIGEKYSIKPTDILEWKYGEVFIEVARNVAQSDVQRSYQEIKANKSK